MTLPSEKTMTPEQQIKAATAGLKVTYFKRWNDPGIAGFRDTTWTPRFVMLHHTGGTSSYAGLSTGALGNHKPVPGANFLVNRDGSVYVLSKFITYHAGKGSGFGVPVNSMNPVCWGIEIEDPGKGQTMTAAQITTVSKLSGGLLKAMGEPLDNLIQHKAWSSTGKPDTLYSDTFWRTHAQSAMADEVSVAGDVIVKDSIHPTVKLHNFMVEEGKWTTFATDWIAKDSKRGYMLGMQLRRAAGVRVQLRVARLGWGAEASGATDNVDATFYVDEAAQPYPSSHTYHHVIEGGGPIAFQVLTHGGLVVPTLIAKVRPYLK